MIQTVLFYSNNLKKINDKTYQNIYQMIFCGAETDEHDLRTYGLKYAVFIPNFGLTGRPDRAGSIFFGMWLMLCICCLGTGIN